MKIGVVVRVPEGDDIAGNLALPMGGLWLARDPRDPMRVEPAPPQLLISARAPVFNRGEILVLDEDGREISGLGRKPSKWDVEVETFDSIEQAAARAATLSSDSEG